MKALKKYLVLLVAIGFFILGCASVSKLKKTFSGSTYQLRPYKELTLKNGLQVLLINDPRFPSFSIEMLIKSGAVSDPADLSGVARLVAGLLDRGTIHHDASQIADLFGQLGTQFSAEVEQEYTRIAATGLAKYQQEILTDFFELITEPSFSEGEITRLRSQALAVQRQLIDRPDAFSAQVFQSYLFGSQIYGRPVSGTFSTLKSIRKKNIIKYYLSYYRPNNSLLAVVGNFDEAKILRQLDELTKNWQPKTVTPAVVENAPQVHGIKIRLINKTDLKQANIFIGQIGIRRTDPDYLALRLADLILGGSFSSRLESEIRIKRGLTYGISSFFDTHRAPGSFEIACSTRVDKTKETVTEILKTLTEFQTNGVTEQELTIAKNSLKGVFPRVLETSEHMAENLLILRFYGVSDDYLKNFFENLDAITLSEVNRAIKQHFDPQNLFIQVYGPQFAIEPQLKTIAPIEHKSFQDLL